MKRATVIFDFDGVINPYLGGWQGPTYIPDPPVKGMREEIIRIREKYDVVVQSSRCITKAGKNAVIAYLKKHDIVVDGVTYEKVPAIAIIDDRGIHFDGNPEGLLEKIEYVNSHLWYKDRE